MNIRFTEKAFNSLDDVLNFLKYKQRLPAEKVTKVRMSITKGIRSLQAHPYKGQIEPLLSHYKKEHRRLVIHHAKVIYRVENETILIVDIFDSRRSPDEMGPFF